MANDILRRATAADSHALSALTWRSKAHWGYDDAFMELNRASLTVSPAYIASRDTILLERDGQPAGFYALLPLDEPADAPVVELDFLFVEPAHMGQGIGRRLFQHAWAAAQRRGYRTMRIVSDPFARPFYEKMGATLWGEWHSAVIPGRKLPVLHMSCG